MKLDDVITAQNKTFGKGTMFYGNSLRYHPPRLPIGVFAVDLISGGGAPVHGSTCFWGAETGAKTYLAISAMKMAGLICWKCFNQLPFCECSTKPVRMKTSWIDIEGTLEREWSDTCGAESDKYIVTLADCAEQGIDCADASLQADDCGLVILDSLGALVPEREMSGSSVDVMMGVQPSVVTRAVKKLKQRMIRERKRGHPCAVIFINQMRKKLGLVFGSNETQSGGHAMVHEFSLLFRCGKKTLSDKKKYGKYHDDERGRWVGSWHTCAIHKEKVFIFARESDFVIIKENIDTDGLSAGMVDDIKAVVKAAEEYGLFVKENGYMLKGIGDYKFKTKKELKNLLIDNIPVYYQLQKKIIEEAVAKIKGK